jgi:hypothetical protein
MTREELRKKLRNKIKQKSYNRMSSYNKSFSSNITEDMRNKYNALLSVFPSNSIHSPEYILANMSIVEIEFKQYLNRLIDIAKSNNIMPNDFHTIINNDYTNYMITVCGDHIIPENLRYIFN